MTAARTMTESELVAWGEELGSGLRPPVVLALTGDLGAGKTTLAQAICRGYGVRDEVTSPTFALVHQYESPRGTVHHVDLYRLDGPRDLQNIGWDDLVRGNSLLIVEWPERAGAAIPRDAVALELRLLQDDPTRRLLVQSSLAGTAA